MRQILFTITLLCAIVATSAIAQQSQYDLNEPFGWATCTSLTSGDDYDLTGGGDGSSITIQADGKDMRQALIDAIKKYDVIVLDGTNGDFIISQTIQLTGLRNKTVVGINNARLCTQFFITDEIRNALDKAGVKDKSSSGGGGKLSNGESVSEEREFCTRQTLIDLLNDEKETYRHAGVFSISECENIIIRNIRFVGPGPVDVGGHDLVSVQNSSQHIWIDHCNFTDGIDGNLDITLKSDFVTISWCTFSYTDRAYDHLYSNLIAGSENASQQGENNLNVTWANNMWGEQCKQRMPMARFGTIHLMNNYYNCPGNSAGINARYHSEFLIENNFFAKGVKNIFSQSDAIAYNWEGNVFVEDFTPTSKGNVHIPYRYSLYAAADVPAVVANSNNGAGNTLTAPLNIGYNGTNNYTVTFLVDGEVYATMPQQTVVSYPDEDPYKSGYTFVGWDTPEGTVLFDDKEVNAIFKVGSGDGNTKQWIFDDWDASGVIPANFSQTFTYDQLTAIYGPKAKFGYAQLQFSDGNIFTAHFDTGGGGSTTSQALSFFAKEGEDIIIYSNAGDRGREVVIFDGENEVLRTSDNIIRYTFTADDTYYIYSGNSGIRFYALFLNQKSEIETLSAQQYGIKYDGNIIMSDSDVDIEIYNLQGVCVAKGKMQVSTQHLAKGIYIVRAGNTTHRILKR